MTKYGRNLQDKVLLKLPNGASWQVELVHYGNGTLLQKGWKEFAEHYSIKMFFFLVFRYKGNSQFDVLIFDPSALEIEYPVEPNDDSSESCFQTSGQRVRSGVPSGLKDLGDDDEEYEEISAQILKKDDQTTTASKGKGKRVRSEDVSIEILDDISHRKPKTRSSKKLTTEKLHSTRKNTKQNKDVKSSVGTTKPLGSSTSISVHRRVINKENFKSYEKAKAFTSSNPFFIAFMHPSYLSGNSNLEIPHDFVRIYLSLKNKYSHVTLRVSERNISWPVTLIVQCALRFRVRFANGWKEFVQDNGLKVGDVCVFQRAPAPPDAKNFEVTIYYSSTEDEIAA